MLGIKELVLKILQRIDGQAAPVIVTSTVSLPYTVPCDGVLTMNLATRSVSASTGAYLYLKRNNANVYTACWNGIANGGQASITFGVKKGDVITGASNNINSTSLQIIPFMGGGTI